MGGKQGKVTSVTLESKQPQGEQEPRAWGHKADGGPWELAETLGGHQASHRVGTGLQLLLFNLKGHMTSANTGYKEPCFILYNISFVY